MKSDKAPKRLSRQPALKRPTAKSVEDYVANVPEVARGNFTALRSAVREAVPNDAIEVISYGIPAFKRGKVLVWFAAFSNHCSLFPTAAVIEDFREELANYRISKGTIQFPLDKPVPTPLITKLVKARVAKAEDPKA